MYGVISPAPASFTFTAIWQYVVCGCESQMLVLAVKGTCTIFALLCKN
jgi:hypothetical protein